MSSKSLFTLALSNYFLCLLSQRCKFSVAKTCTEDGVAHVRDKCCSTMRFIMVYVNGWNKEIQINDSTLFVYQKCER